MRHRGGELTAQGEFVWNPKRARNFEARVSDVCGSFAVITKKRIQKDFPPFVSAAQLRGSTLVMGRKLDIALNRSRGREQSL